ncbi:protocadherin gamma-A7-like [Seriola dumerili]|uniref:protocadherin gamma-A7-like n=1 Tax=Seriola dumerili TaxID=41447 RepID=UPI000BBEB41B|nr:protocadherin gamma-A7-like [Seriola dumerili]
MRRQVLLFILILYFSSVIGQVSYSISEEKPTGSFVGDIAQDLGLDVKRLKSGKARIYTGDSAEYIELNKERGVLLVKDRIDREVICAQTSPCALHFQVILENPMEFYSITILIQDQNDNPPQVLYPVQTGGSLVAEMVPRSADVGYLVTKVVAVDVDSGQNAWLSYKLQKATDRALFEVGLQNGEIRTIRQVTDKDAVKQRLTVIVEDNGQPSRSASVIVNVAVADSFPAVLSEFTDFTHDKEYNDNLTFYLVLALAVVSFLFITCLVVIISVKIYRWRQSRILYHSNLPVIPYYPPRYSDTLGTGTLQHVYNYEVCRTTDSRKSDCKFGRAGSQNVLIMDPSSTGTMQRTQNEKSILDEPDSPLEVSYSIPEEMAKGSLIGNIAQDLGLDRKRLTSGKARIFTGDSAEHIELNSERGVLLIKEKIDREALSVTLTLQISDVNDNAPVFERSSYEAYIVENNTPGLSIFTVKARDADWNQNARVSYILEDSSVNGVPVSSYVSVSADSGVIHAVRSFDYEQIKDFHFRVKAQDGGSPPLNTLGTGTLQHVYNYEVCRTTDSRKSDCKFGRAGSQNVLIMDPSSTGTMQRIQNEKSILDEPDSPIEL